MKFLLRLKRFLIAAVIVGVLLPILMISASAEYAGFSNFSRTRSYTQGQFTDVSEGAWYADYVIDAYELELVEGAGNNAFKPGKSITVAETITLASKLHNIYHGRNYSFETSSPWYQAYVDYAVTAGIIYEGQFSSFSVVATRADFAVIFANALPAAALMAINDITEIPDVQAAAPYADAVYRLYNAGILCGNDVYGTFNPDSEIKRNEVATILTRMAEPSTRETFELCTLQEESFDTYAAFICRYGNDTINGNPAYFTSVDRGENVENNFWYAYEMDSDKILIHQVAIIDNCVHCVDLWLTRTGKEFQFAYYWYESAEDTSAVIRGAGIVDALQFSKKADLKFTSFSTSQKYNNVNNVIKAQENAVGFLQDTIEQVDEFMYIFISCYGHCDMKDFGFEVTP